MKRSALPWWCCLGWKSYLCAADRLLRCKVRAICDAHDRAVLDPARWGEPQRAKTTGPALWGCQHMTASVPIDSTPCCGPAQRLPVNGVAA